MHIPLAGNIECEDGVLLPQALGAFALQVPAPQFVARHKAGDADHQRAQYHGQHVPPADIHFQHTLRAHTGDDGEIHNPDTERDIAQAGRPGLAGGMHPAQHDGHQRRDAQHGAQLHGHLSSQFGVAEAFHLHHKGHEQRRDEAEYYLAEDQGRGGEFHIATQEVHDDRGGNGHRGYAAEKERFSQHRVAQSAGGSPEAHAYHLDA